MKQNQAPPSKRRRAALGQSAQAAHSPRPGVWLVVVLLLAVALTGLALQRRLDWWPSGAPSSSAETPALPPGAPPVDAVAMLGLPDETQQTVEQFKAEALTTAEQLVQSLPDRSEAHAVMALAQLQFGQKEQALKSWEAALELNPQFAPAVLGIGLIRAERAEYDLAVPELLQAIDLDPQVGGEAYCKLTEVLLTKGDAQRAIEVAQTAARRFPDLCQVHYWLGQAHLQAGNYQEAQGCHTRAVEIYPAWSLPYYGLAVACARLGQREEATRYRQRFAQLKAVEEQEDRGQTQEYDDLATQRQMAVSGHLSAGRVEWQYGDPRKAEAHWVRASALAQNDPTPREALVSLYTQQTRPAAAIHYLRQLSQIEPDNPQHPLRIGRGLVEMGAWLEAPAPLERAIRLRPDLPEAHLLLAAVREHQGDVRGARTALKKALDLEPNNLHLRRAYGQLSAHD